MLNTMEHRGILGYIEYVPYSNEFQVKTHSLTNNFYVFGKSADELKQNFINECDNYITNCENNKTPVFKTVFGSIFSINISPHLHEMALTECTLKKITIDELIENALNKYLNHTYF